MKFSLPLVLCASALPLAAASTVREEFSVVEATARFLAGKKGGAGSRNSNDDRAGCAEDDTECHVWGAIGGTAGLIVFAFIVYYINKKRREMQKEPDFSAVPLQGKVRCHECGWGLPRDVVGKDRPTCVDCGKAFTAENKFKFSCKKCSHTYCYKCGKERIAGQEYYQMELANSTPTPPETRTCVLCTGGTTIVQEKPSMPTHCTVCKNVCKVAFVKCAGTDDLALCVECTKGNRDKAELKANADAKPNGTVGNGQTVDAVVVGQPVATPEAVKVVD